MTRKITPEIITGRTTEHLTAFFATNMYVHHEVVEPLKRLCKRAAKKGFEIAIASAFRDFEGQLRIWNSKMTGTRPVLDSTGKTLDMSSLPPNEKVHAALRWSALPGASRHHWGTDLDIFDQKAIDQNYKVQLTKEEVESGGPFAPMHDWLDEVMWEEGFFRPYEFDQGGVSTERWHISYAPVSQCFRKHFEPSMLRNLLADVSIEEKATILDELDAIYGRYIDKICDPVWYME